MLIRKLVIFLDWNNKLPVGSSPTGNYIAKLKFAEPIDDLKNIIKSDNITIYCASTTSIVFKNINTINNYKGIAISNYSAHGNFAAGTHIYTLTFSFASQQVGAGWDNADYGSNYGVVVGILYMKSKYI